MMYFVTTKKDLNNTFNIFSRFGLYNVYANEFAVLSVSPKHVMLYGYIRDNKSEESVTTSAEIACSRIDVSDLKENTIYIKLDARALKRFISSTKNNEKVTLDFNFKEEDKVKIDYITKDNVFTLDGYYSYDSNNSSFITCYDNYNERIKGNTNFIIDLPKNNISAQSIGKKLNWLDTTINDSRLACAFISLYDNKLEIAAASSYTLSKSVYTLDKSYTDEPYSSVVGLKPLKKLANVKDVFTKMCITIGEDYREVLFIKDDYTYLVFSSGQASIYPNLDKAIVPEQELPCKCILDYDGILKMLGSLNTCLTAYPEVAKLIGVYLNIDSYDKNILKITLNDLSHKVLFEQKLSCETPSGLSSSVLVDTKKLIKLLKSVKGSEYKDAKFTFNFASDKLRPFIITNTKDIGYIQELTVNRVK